MAGKSTVLRQTALICLLAHMGSFVPAEAAEIGLVDKIFCRVGAQDNLARGESTFLVEMHETAYILNTATSRSLVIMDEVGRGTGTLDGLSIAWAVSERLLDRIGCRTLFATHYHELCSLEHKGLVNLSMAVLENEGEIVFLKRLKEGPAAGSYGLHVAKLAGIPAEVLERAKELQGRLAAFERDLSETGAEKAESEAEGQTEISNAETRPRRAVAELFSPGEMAEERIRNVDPDRMTPLEALKFVAELKSSLI
jgi:DNA mismatch repair protein MutS